MRDSIVEKSVKPLSIYSISNVSVFSDVPNVIGAFAAVVVGFTDAPVNVTVAGW
jgi:hypothetical protein